MTDISTGSLPAPPARDRYDRITIVFHWITALLVFALFGTSLLWNYAPRDWGMRSLEGVHVSLGILLAAVLIGRLIWRTIAGRRLPAIGSAATKLLSRIVHLALYVLLTLQVGLGFALRWVQGEDFSFFGLFSIPGFFEQNRQLARSIEQVHNITAWTLMALVLGHAVAALFHRYVLKDGVLRRMIPAAG